MGPPDRKREIHSGSIGTLHILQSVADKEDLFCAGMGEILVFQDRIRRGLGRIHIIRADDD